MKLGKFLFLTISLVVGGMSVVAQVTDAQQHQASVPTPLSGELEEKNKALARRL